MQKAKLFMFTLIAFLVVGFAVNVKADEATSVSTLEELVVALNTVDSVKLEADITLPSAFMFPEEMTKIIDLNGNTLTFSGSSATRLITNYGDLTIKNGSVKQTNDSAYGIIDNYGTLTLDKVTLEDAGCGNGSTIKNRPSDPAATLTITNSEFNNTCVNLGNAGVYSDGVLTISDTTLTSVSNRAYALIVNSGTATITNVKSHGTHGGFGINGGDVTVNSGTFQSDNYYGVWITNNGNTKVLINDGTFIGNLYGLYAAVDDGRQDVGDTDIVINGGSFKGNTKAAAALNNSGSVRDWGLAINKGTFSTSVSDYVTDGNSEYELADDEYLVDPTIEKITLEKTETTLAIGKTLALKPSVTPSKSTTGYTYSSSNTKVATVDSNGKVTAVAKGTATITVKSTYDTSKTATIKVTTKIDISKAKVSGIVNKTYNNKIKKQPLVVKLDGKTLKDKTDYNVSYKNNVKIGTVTFTITGKGDYTGTITKTFKIIPAKVKIKSFSTYGNSITVKYKGVAGGVKYDVAYKQKSNGNWKHVKVSATKYKARYLKYNTKYYFKVRAYKVVDGETYYGAWSTIKTKKLTK